MLPAWLPVGVAVSFELSEYENKPPAHFCVPSEEAVGRGKGLCQSPAFRPRLCSAPGSPSLSEHSAFLSVSGVGNVSVPEQP